MSRTVPAGKKRVHEKLTTTKSFESGRVRPEEHGATLGYWSFYKYGKPRRKKVINLGPVMLGTEVYLLGAAVGEPAVFLGMNGKLWRVKGKGSNLSFDVIAPKTTDPDALRAWANTMAQRIVDSLSPKLEVQVNKESNLRYRNMIKALINKRIDEGISLGYDRSYSYYAKSINEDWSVHDLLNPRYPTMKHSIYVSLILALPAKQAAQLIAGAAMYEFKCPYITDDIALTIYQQAVSLLSRLCPEWWNNGAFTRWEYVGSLDTLFTKQYANTLVNAQNLDVDLSTAAGLTRSEPLGTLLRRRQPWPKAEE